MKDERERVHLLLLNNRRGEQKCLKNNLNSSAPTYLPIFKNIETLKKAGGHGSMYVGCNLSY